MMQYVINLTPVSKKNSQQIMVNRATGRPFIMPSKKYKAYEKNAGVYLTPRPKTPVSDAVNVRCLFYMPTRRRVDLTNLLESVDDVLVHYGILEDDHSGVIAAHDGSRVFYDKERPRTEIYITQVEGAL